MTTPPHSGDELPSIAERVTLALYLLYPDTQVDDLNEVAAAHINESHRVSDKMASRSPIDQIPHFGGCGAA